MLWLAYALLFLYGLVHTPLLVDILRQAFPHWNIQRVTSGASSFVLILLMSLLFLLGLGMQLFIFIPFMPQVTHRPIKLVLHSTFAYWVWINAVTNYAYTLFSRPGIFRPSLQEGDDGTHYIAPTSRESNVKDSVLHSQESNSGGDTPPGSESGPRKPPNSHYCKICQATIPYRDHHCPFTGNCIGLDNYSYFYLGLLYSVLGLGYGITVFFVYFGNCVFLAWKAIGTVQSEEMEGVCVNLEPYGELVLPGIGAMVTLTTVLLFHTFLLMADISTYDLLKHWRTTRIDPRRFQRKNSRFRVLLLSKRANPFWFLLPVRSKT